ADVGVDAVEKLAQVGDRIARGAVLVGGEGGELRIVRGTEVVGLDAVARAARGQRVDVDGDEDVAVRGVGDGGAVAQGDEAVVAARDDDVEAVLAENLAQTRGDGEGDGLLRQL